LPTGRSSGDRRRRAVNSVATVKLITGAMGETVRDRAIAEALRRSMIALIDSGEARRAHPSYWAPFVVGGDGSAQAAK